MLRTHGKLMLSHLSITPLILFQHWLGPPYLKDLRTLMLTKNKMFEENTEKSCILTKQEEDNILKVNYDILTVGVLYLV